MKDTEADNRYVHVPDLLKCDKSESGIFKIDGRQVLSKTKVRNHSSTTDATLIQACKPEAIIELDHYLIITGTKWAAEESRNSCEAIDRIVEYMEEVRCETGRQPYKTILTESLYTSLLGIVSEFVNRQNSLNLNLNDFFHDTTIESIPDLK